MSPITTALIDYWQRLPADSVLSRRENLEEVRKRVRNGATAATDLVPYALADHDADVVYLATEAYVGRGTGSIAPGADAVADALQWIRRGLALNRGAVFAALLSLGEPEVNESLAGLRLTLDAGEVETVCRRAPVACSVRTREFLRSWLELLAEDALDRERGLLSRALAQE